MSASYIIQVSYCLVFVNIFILLIICFVLLKNIKWLKRGVNHSFLSLLFLYINDKIFNKLILHKYYRDADFGLTKLNDRLVCVSAHRQAYECFGGWLKIAPVFQISDSEGHLWKDLSVKEERNR